MHATRGILLGIDGCIAIFSESLNESLTFHTSMMESLARASAQSSVNSAPTPTEQSKRKANLAGLAAQVMNASLPSPHLLGDFVRQETNVLTISEVDLLLKDRRPPGRGQVLCSARCLFLFAYFAGHADEEIRQLAVLTLLLWAGSRAFHPASWW